MKRKKAEKSQTRNQAKESSQGASLADRLNGDLADKLKQLKKDKEAELQKQREEEQARKQFEAKQREKNKSFEELLAESNMDWKKFK